MQIFQNSSVNIMIANGENRNRYTEKKPVISRRLNVYWVYRTCICRVILLSTFIFFTGSIPDGLSFPDYPTFPSP